ncbi:MAG: PqqD family protein [Fibrobacterota bacterium]
MNLKKLKNLAISENGYIFDPASGNSFTANETALFIIGQLKEGRTAEEITDDLADTYEVAHTTAEEDAMKIIEILQSNNMV